MSGWSDAFSFDRYADALARQAAMDPSGFALMQTAVLGSLATGAFLCLIIALVRRSGTATAGFALLVLTGLSQALLFGLLDFLTPDTKVLLGALTASALLVFTNAVLHTGRENILIAGLSTVVVGALLALAGAVMLDKPFGAEARLAMLGSAGFSSLLLLYAMLRDPKGKALLGAGVVLAVLAAMLMTDEAVPLTRGLLPASFPSVLITLGILVAALAAPFLADEHRISAASHRSQREAPTYVPTSLFGDEPAAPSNSGIFRRPEPQPEEPFQRNEPAPAPEPHRFAPLPPFGNLSEPADEPQVPELGADAGFTSPALSDTASSNWVQGQDAGFEPAADEYVWDALAQPEVRCGADLLKAFGADNAQELTLEGMRERLQDEALASFDENVLGGGEPESGTFDLDLETASARFRLEGRRKVDHDGVLTRIDAQVLAIKAKPAPSTSAGLSAPAVLPGIFRPISDLRSDAAAGLEIAPKRALSEEEVKAATAQGAAILRSMIDSGRADAVLMIDGHGLGVRPGIIAAAVGKAVRQHDLPKGSVVVGLVLPLPREVKAFSKIAGDLKLAGASVALILPGPSAKATKKLNADAVWLPANQVTGRKAKRSPVEKVAYRFGVPVHIRNVSSETEEADLRGAGATLVAGPHYSELFLPAGGNFGGGKPDGMAAKVGQLR
jgi:hypothetical protein